MVVFFFLLRLYCTCTYFHVVCTCAGRYLEIEMEGKDGNMEALRAPVPEKSRVELVFNLRPGEMHTGHIAVYTLRFFYFLQVANGRLAHNDTVMTKINREMFTFEHNGSYESTDPVDVLISRLHTNHLRVILGKHYEVPVFGHGEDGPVPDEPLLSPTEQARVDRVRQELAKTTGDLEVLYSVSTE